MTESARTPNAHINRSYSREARAAVVKFTRSGGVFRQILRNADVHPDTEGWRGRPGADIAREVYEGIVKVAGEGTYPVADEVLTAAHQIAKGAGFIAVGEQPQIDIQE